MGSPARSSQDDIAITVPLEIADAGDAVPFYKEIWNGYRPYLIRIAIDFLVFCTFYVAVVFVDVLGRQLPTKSWEGNWLVHIHSFGIIAAVAIFVWLSVNDIVQVSRRK